MHRLPAPWQTPCWLLWQVSLLVLLGPAVCLVGHLLLVGVLGLVAHLAEDPVLPQGLVMCLV